MKEAQTRIARLEDVHEDTFVCVCQFAYTGDYETPVFIQRPESRLLDKPSLISPPPNIDANELGEIVEELEPERAEPQAELDVWSSFGAKRPKKLKKSYKSRVLRDSFDKRIFNVETPRLGALYRCEVRQNSTAEEDYTSVFLGYTALKKVLPLCIERIDDLGSSADAKPPSKELTALKTLLSALLKLSEARIVLITPISDARTLDIGEDTVPVSAASKIREAITSKINSNIRAELRRQIDGRYAKKAAQYDSVTGTSSSINVGHILQPPASISEDEEDYMSAQEYLPSRTSSPSRFLRKVTSEMGKSYEFLVLS
ncbi:hypothetical protein V500_03127 [Pseudogymnoascus sp. VKM F-4518 (FW-2643)]|nr:hypothetical protein V500_03127 [Pseudogymnoascus sp. VKM F-4518 (FW-2643)]